MGSLLIAAPRPLNNAERWRPGLRAVLAIAYFAVGCIHLRSPGAFLPITPSWVPMPYETIIATGLCEVAGSAALFVPRLRWWAGTMLAAYAVCVYPANIKHAMDHVAIGGTTLGLWYHVPRLAFQPVIIWWALFAGGVVDWPFLRKGLA